MTRSADRAARLRMALGAMRRRAQAAEADMRALERESVRLRNALTEMLTVEEAQDLDGDWNYDWPKPPRLCYWLADYIRRELGSEDLERYKRARKALGLPWWGGLDYEDGLQPGRGK